MYHSPVATPSGSSDVPGARYRLASRDAVGTSPPAGRPAVRPAAQRPNGPRGCGSRPSHSLMAEMASSCPPATRRGSWATDGSTPEQGGRRRVTQRFERQRRSRPTSEGGRALRRWEAGTRAPTSTPLVVRGTPAPCRHSQSPSAGTSPYLPPATHCSPIDMRPPSAMPGARTHASPQNSSPKAVVTRTCASPRVRASTSTATTNPCLNSTPGRFSSTHLSRKETSRRSTTTRGGSAIDAKRPGQPRGCQIRL